MPVTATNEISGYIAWNAWADDIDKGSPGAGDGLTPGTAFDTIDAALASFTGITTADVSVVRTAVSTWEIEMVNALALTDLQDIAIHDDGLVGFTHAANLTVLQQGTTALNERYRIVLTSTTGGWFRLERVSITGRRLEERVAQRWIADTILADPAMQILIANRVYTGRVSMTVQAAATNSGDVLLLIDHTENEDMLGIGGARIFSAHRLAVIVLARLDEPNDRLDYAAQRLSELFEFEQSIVLTDGTMLSCVRIAQVDETYPGSTWFFDPNDHWILLGIILEVNVQQTP